MKNFNFFFFFGRGGGSLENRIFMGREVPEKPLYRGVLPKRGGGAWTVSKFKRGAWQKIGKWCF